MDIIWSIETLEDGYTVYKGVYKKNTVYKYRSDSDLYFTIEGSDRYFNTEKLLKLHIDKLDELPNYYHVRS